MSVQFGRWNFEGEPSAPDYIEKVSAALAPYGPDSNESYSKDGLKILYRAFCTTKESWHETQPHVSSSGAVITWDGRLDNRTELISELHDMLSINSTDVEIAAGAYESWGADCLGKLIGDWALSVSIPRERSVLLAKDPIGSKHLYYSFQKDHVAWSTILDPLVLFAGRTFEISEEYVAGWLSVPMYPFPATHLTPYVGIHSVPPSSFVLLRPGKHGINHTIKKYWDFDSSRRIRYRTDAEYEEHFRSALATAVERRLRSDRPVLAELSGGMDSSSIVCIADLVLAQANSQPASASCQGRPNRHLNITPSADLTPRLDTISWDNYSDPSWNETPYFTRVEEKRGRTGFHIDLGVLRQRSDKKQIGSNRSFMSEFESNRFPVTPYAITQLNELLQEYAEHITSQGHRVTLSGIGGDDITGSGVPTPTPEFQNLIATARFVTLAERLNIWATTMQQPRLPLLWKAVREFLPSAFVDISRETPWATCLNPHFVRRNHAALCGYPARLKLFGPLPSFQHHIASLNIIRRPLAHSIFPPEMRREARYPYFDRNLMEFMFAIPREQIVRPGQRRALMRRALVGIVPDELMKPRRNTLSQQGLQKESPKDSSKEWFRLVELCRLVGRSSTRIIDPNRFLEILRNDELSTGMLDRPLFLESWLYYLTVHGVLTTSTPKTKHNYWSPLRVKEFQAPSQNNKFS
jgi:asparagine synthase (glutamine-hydrolysing)